MGILFDKKKKSFAQTWNKKKKNVKNLLAFKRTFKFPKGRQRKVRLSCPFNDLEFHLQSFVSSQCRELSTLITPPLPSRRSCSYYVTNLRSVERRKVEVFWEFVISTIRSSKETQNVQCSCECFVRFGMWQIAKSKLTEICWRQGNIKSVFIMDWITLLIQRKSSENSVISTVIWITKVEPQKIIIRRWKELAGKNVSQITKHTSNASRQITERVLSARFT